MTKGLNHVCMSSFQINSETPGSKVLSQDQPLLSTKPWLASRAKCSRYPNQTRGMETHPDKVIAMVANVAAFGLCGSSQNIGTEVKSS